jgi:hypothetical protein
MAGYFVIDIILDHFSDLTTAAVVPPVVPVSSRDEREAFLHSNAFDLRYQVPLFGCMMIAITLFSAG